MSDMKECVICAVVGTLVITVVWLTTSQDGTTIPRVVSCVNKIKKDGRGLGTRLVFYQLLLCISLVCLYHISLVPSQTVCSLFVLLMNNEASTTSANRYEKIYNSQLVPALKQKVPS